MFLLCLRCLSVSAALVSLLFVSVDVLLAQGALPTKSLLANWHHAPALPPRDCPAKDIDSYLRSPRWAKDPDPPSCTVAPSDVPVAAPCAANAAGSSRCETAGHAPLETPIPASLGKKGQSISAARARVLEILDTDNGCSAWFRGGDPNPARVFRTLSFEVDSKAPGSVLEVTANGSSESFVSPYVALVTQAGGEYQTITLNGNGAFFRPTATLVRSSREGGPYQFGGARTLKVGPYMGDTLFAQTATLLHELGHVIGLLPLDTGDANGRSAANTREMLRHCQSEIEAPRAHRSLGAIH